MKRDPAGALRAFSDLLRAVAVPAGFVAASDAHRLHERHTLDSVRAADALRDGDGRVVDIGSGAGLPGIPLAIVLPHRRFLLCEAQAKRVGFLELAVERLGLVNVEVRHARVEELPAGSASAATARAFAPLERTWPLARRLLVPGGSLVFFAGASLEDPLALAEDVAGGGADCRLLASEPPLVMMTRR